MKAFITGATGFIGSYLTKYLVDEGHKVLCLKRESSDLYRLDDYVGRIMWINTTDDWKQALRNFTPDIVYNLAWDGVSATDRVKWMKQVHNIELQQELLDISLECDIKKFVGVGSQSEYGEFESKIDETYTVDPKTAYAASKAAALMTLKSFCSIHNIGWYWFRLFPLFGPYESDRWLIPALIKNICTTDHMDLTLGEQKLAYLYVGECAKAIASPICTTGNCGVYNVCSDRLFTLKELVTKIRNRINPKFKLNFGAQPYRYGQCMHMEGNTEKLRKNLYDLKTDDFEKRLDETIDYYLRIFKKS